MRIVAGVAAGVDLVMGVRRESLRLMAAHARIAHPTDVPPLPERVGGGDIVDPVALATPHRLPVHLPGVEPPVPVRRHLLVTAGAGGRGGRAGVGEAAEARVALGAAHVAVRRALECHRSHRERSGLGRTVHVLAEQLGLAMTSLAVQITLACRRREPQGEPRDRHDHRASYHSSIPYLLRRFRTW